VAGISLLPGDVDTGNVSSSTQQSQNGHNTDKHDHCINGALNVIRPIHFGASVTIDQGGSAPPAARLDDNGRQIIPAVRRFRRCHGDPD